ncbi:5-methyltetrahydropteroyltriglutamate--homocysteine S-methyltransferase [Candidatus Tremblaya phenacola]|uniref:5-methyltetrahydropteroyltriglutamate-- homocysteine S-methyltransferase n=1 Tax=Candidatus Tremblayella phenacoccinincola TaxID=1010676 RepID=UPI00197D53A0|nr:5-methyltetrahydropteroyltriglutamate--homocysteine S-methyltransferase [Candidatus Tremblaya phenacola]KAH0998214.1 5-methyltetrahydropteroyltriglutamate--homocysteine methyltransferase [Candidatus Tremblaya phenacola]
MVTAHLLGFPRIGFNRELKFTLESYWNHRTPETKELLFKTRKEICLKTWKMQKLLRLDFLTVGDFSFYDHVLSTLCGLGGLPKRYGFNVKSPSIDNYFDAARGNSNFRAMDLKKWFNTNYHYLVPEYTSGMEFHAEFPWLLEEIELAKTLQHPIKVCMLGPASLLWLGKEYGGLVNRIEVLPRLLEAYKRVLMNIKFKGVEWVQLEEPIASFNLPAIWRRALSTTYEQLSSCSPRILFTSYYAFPNEMYSFLKSLPVDGFHFDITNNVSINLLESYPSDKVLSVGIVSGRDVWKNDLKRSIHRVERLRSKIRSELWVSTSCPLLHVPCDLSTEGRISESLKRKLSFGVQKIQEAVAIKEHLTNQNSNIATSVLVKETHFNPRVGFYTEELENECCFKRLSYLDRIKLQKNISKHLIFPTTTVGSFPQTEHIRKIRSQFKKGNLTQKEYITTLKTEVSFIIKKQAVYGLDVFVHGEVERNDMVEYFGELVEGFMITENGWIQSFGSRCTKPPIVFKDLSFIRPITVYWTRYAQGLTNKPVKGMVTGPMTILNWSFLRKTQTIQEMSLQIASVLRKEVNLLENHGTRIVQIDEPAIREGLPLLYENWNQYLSWSVKAFHIVSSGVSASTQIHTHLCYSEFGEIVDTLVKLDTDVISIEAARSNMVLLEPFKECGFTNEIGPGVYDIHSPMIPSVEEVLLRIKYITTSISKERVWVNPDCGLKTRTWSQVDSSLSNMVKAAKIARLQEPSV